MTAQISERLVYKGERLALCAEPLNQFFDLSGSKPDFAETSTALWRGYVGSWEIVDERLYLVELNGVLVDGTAVNLETVFPGYPDRVFAHWYNGRLRIPQGRQLEYVHMGYGSTFERDLLIDIEQGRVTATEVRENGVSDNPNAPDEYGPGAMVVFPPRRRIGDPEDVE